MGIRIIANEAVAPWNSKVAPPVTRGLEGWFTFDTSADRFALNRAIGKSNASIVGSPVAYPTHGRFKGMLNFLQTDIAETVEATFICVGKAAAAVGSTLGDTSPFYVGNYSGTLQDPAYTGTGYGISMYHGTTNDLTATSCRPTSAASNVALSAVVSQTDDTPTAWGIRALRTSNKATAAFNLTRNAKVETQFTTPRLLANTKMRVGSGTRLLGGEVDISVIAIYSVALTDEEIAKVADVMRKRMARLGIQV